ncbi:MAG: hypothetical protein WA324_30770 [Bryobacteraceae bacterium]
MSSADKLIPISQAVFHILLCLGEGERHGYAVRREIGKRTNGKLKLGRGLCKLNGFLASFIWEVSGWAARLDGHLSAPGTSASVIPIMADYFAATGGRVLYGRDFTDAEVRSNAVLSLFVVLPVQ